MRTDPIAQATKRVGVRFPVRPIALACLLAALVFAPVAIGFSSTPAAAQNGTTTATDSDSGSASVVVRQNGQCYPISAYGNGTQSVSEYYDYRSPFVEPSGWYHAYGPIDDLLREDTSQILLYNGSDGLSLVFVNDGAGSGPASGGTVALDITGLPENGNLSVQDDDYPEQDDVFDVSGSNAHIEWYWNNGNRSDGAAFVGLEGNDWNAITIDPGFNEDSPGYPYYKWEGDPEDNRITSWIARSADNSTYDLDMNDPVTITPGPCDDEAPSASLTADPTTAAPDENVTLDAGESTDNRNVSTYRFDADGDGQVDAVTNSSTVTATYDEPGDYTARVTVVDGANNTANASASIRIDAEPTTTRSPTRTPTSTTESSSNTDSTDNDSTATPTDDSNPIAGPLDSAHEIASAAASGLSGLDRGNLAGVSVIVVALLVLGVVALRR